jgi:transcriptional regulator with XRE-family HTH domain
MRHKQPRIVNKRHLNLKFKRLFPDTGDRLWAYRQTKGMSQAQLGEDCGLAGGTISRFECGYTLGMGASIQKLARGLGISADYLLDISDSIEIHDQTITRRKHG